MTTERIDPPRFDEPTARARAVALAGWLAERGVTRVLLICGGTSRELSARATDLPGELLRSAPCTVEAPSLGRRFEVTAAAIIPA